MASHLSPMARPSCRLPDCATFKMNRSGLHSVCVCVCEDQCVCVTLYNTVVHQYTRLTETSDLPSV